MRALVEIEITTGASETNGSIRTRTIRMAQALKARGMKKGDVIMISAVNHNDICIPYIASLYIGTIPLPLTTDMKHLEIKHIVSMGKPKMVFADPVIAPAIQKVTSEMERQIEIVIFGNEDMEGYTQFSEFVKPTGTEDNFECDDFDPAKTICVLSCSSGTTGLPKLVALSHVSLYLSISDLNTYFLSEIERKNASYLIFSSLYWISGAGGLLMACLFGITLLHCVKPFSPEIFEEATKKYKPTLTVVNQVTLSSLLKYAETNDVDFTSFRVIGYGGSAINAELLDELQKRAVNAVMYVLYGCTEVLNIAESLTSKKESCGKINPMMQWKIVDVETGKALGPNQPGEMRVKSPNRFTEYYNCPEATVAAYDKDGWFKTGDLMYYDDEGYFYVVDRIKELIKYRNYQIGTIELENVICSILGVMVAGVVGVPHPEDGEHPMAFVQLAQGAEVSAQQIKDYVKNNMSDSKQLRGGVVFLDKIPTTYSGKIDRKCLKAMKTMYRGE
ncbi:luciferin 4-monooxygenase-like isoform X2 [Arctopsyche grandis]|uniref:luciferin 4-monooxygenase-like isoform X2 n=1 Tax=Arctopsyche grandis TaxID=121162 RepID=UPI00406D8E22